MSGSDGGLRALVNQPLPGALPARSATSLFVYGVCFHDEHAIERLDLLADGEPVPAMAHSMPRIDVYNDFHHGPQVWDSKPKPAGRNEVRSYRSGFWGTLPVRMPDAGAVAIAVRARLADGSVLEAPLGSIEVKARPAPGDPAGARIGIAMATYNPDPALFRAQIESIRKQTRTDWVCVISDDCSSPGHLEAIRGAIGDDERFLLTGPPRRLGFYRNFEHCLTLLPADVELIALSDQDDRWYPEKLETLAGALGKAQLVYSDQRVVDVDGNEVAPSYWAGKRSNNYSNTASLLIANTVTGAASLFRRELLGPALPFPETPGQQYHDHWLALVADAAGGIAYVDRPLYDYVQHGAAAIGYEGSNRDDDASPPGDGAGKGGLRARLSGAGSGSRVSYFFAYVRLRVLAETLLLRFGSRMGRRSRRALHRFIPAERSALSIAWLATRRLRERFGHTETLGAERIILLGIAWRYAIAVVGRLSRSPLPGVTYDAGMPPSDEASGASEAAGIDHSLTRRLAETIQPLELSVTASAPVRVNLLVPTIELQHLFGGYIAKFNLARKLAAGGHRVRLLTVDPTPALPNSWRSQVEAYAGLDGLFDEIEVAFARDLDSPVEMNPADAIVATTWWTAQIANSALEQLDRSRFLYLIQEFEPFTHQLGSWSAFAMGTYSMPHMALFSTEFLRRYFAARGYGVYAGGEEEGDRDSAAFQNAITAVTAPGIEEMRSRERRRLLFYARPEPHGTRNMFELGLLALRRAVAAGVFDSSWDFYGIGAVGGRDSSVPLSGDRQLELLSKRGQGDYADLLASHDLGLSLMYTPHPSLVPIEMASAGMVTVTNSYETKTPEAMAEISPNLITAPADLEGIVAGLREAVARTGDFEGRSSGAAVEWSSDWDRSFDEELMARVNALIERT